MIKLNDLELSQEEWNMIIEGVDALKMKDMPGEMMEVMLSGLLAPKESASEEEKNKWEEQQSIRQMERQLRKDKQDNFIEKIELLKAKLIIFKNSIKET